MKAIGGYFGLELQHGSEFHKNAVRVNTGRNALEYILRLKNYKKIFLPVYTCEVVLEPIKKLGIRYDFYRIDTDFEPLFDFQKLGPEEGFLYPNYFGLKDEYIQKLAEKSKNLIVDNAQAFYAEPITGIPTFYSPRKFFGVPDGGYLYAENLNATLETDSSYHRFEHLLVRTEKGAESGYPAFGKNEKNLENQPLRKMSNLTQKLLAGIDYGEVAKKRTANFNYLAEALARMNKLVVQKTTQQIPMTYPLWSEDENLREHLINKKIYTPQYWPNVLEWAPKNSLEHRFAEKLVFLPIDQRYGKKEMNIIIDTIKV